MQSKAAGLEAEIQAERRAQRDLKLVLAAAEKQAQQDSNERRETAVRCSTPLSPSSLHTSAVPPLHGSTKIQSGHTHLGTWERQLFGGVHSADVFCSVRQSACAQVTQRLHLGARCTAALFSTNAIRCVQAGGCREGGCPGARALPGPGGAAAAHRTVCRHDPGLRGQGPGAGQQAGCGPDGESVMLA